MVSCLKPGATQHQHGGDGHVSWFLLVLNHASLLLVLLRRLLGAQNCHLLHHSPPRFVLLGEKRRDRAPSSAWFSSRPRCRDVMSVFVPSVDRMLSPWRRDTLQNIAPTSLVLQNISTTAIFDETQREPNMKHLNKNYHVCYQLCTKHIGNKSLLITFGGG